MEQVVLGGLRERIIDMALGIKSLTKLVQVLNRIAEDLFVCFFPTRLDFVLCSLVHFGRHAKRLQILGALATRRLSVVLLSAFLEGDLSRLHQAYSDIRIRRVAAGALIPVFAAGHEGCGTEPLRKFIPLQSEEFQEMLKLNLDYQAHILKYPRQRFHQVT
jgi:hypothetical protein